MSGRGNLYFALNFAFILFVVTAATIGASDNPRVLYLCVLFAICSSTLLFAGKPNGPDSILIILLAYFFVAYGAFDVLALLNPAVPQATRAGSILSPAEIVILLSVLLIALGYRAAVALPGRARAAWTAEWSDQAATIVGLTLWLLGIAATWVWSSEVVERYVVKTQLGPWQAMGITLARYALPVGFALVAYKFVASRVRFLWLIVLAMLAIEFVLGFIADSKELSFRGAVILLVTSYLVYGKVPKTWLGIATLVVIVTFPVFQAYRYEVLQVRGQTRTQGAQDLRKNLQTALAADITKSSSVGDWSGALGRVSMKPTIEMIVARVGKDVAYQDGYTIELLFMGFIPRIIWPSKPDSAVGQLFNRQFQVSGDPDTYISPTHLGELYWNFGWPGILFGAPLIGFVLGHVGSRFNLSEHRSLTRLLVLAVTVYLLCLRFEGGIALTYTQWIRSLALVLVLHLIFARRVAAASPTPAVAGSDPPRLSIPNLMG